MRCSICGGKMNIMDNAPGAGDDWTPVTYVCSECDDIIYL